MLGLVIRIIVVVYAVLGPTWGIAREKTVSIGLLFNFTDSETGKLNPYGTDFKNGVQLALEASSLRLAKRGVKVESRLFDYGNTKQDVLTVVKETAQSDVIAVLGYNLSSDALQAIPIHQDKKLPMITPGATADRLATLGPYIHLACSNNSFMASVLAEVARKRLGAQTVTAVVARDCVYCRDLADHFKREFRMMEGKTVDVVFVSPSEKDFSSVVNRVKKNNADVVLVPDYEELSAKIIKNLTDAGVKKPFLGGDGWGISGEKFFKILGSQSVETYSLTPWHSDLKDEFSREFTKSYKEKFHKQPSDTSVLAYDSALLFVEAIMQAESLTREGVEQALNSIKKFHGVTGLFYYDRSVAPRKSIVLLQAKAKKFQVLERIEPLAPAEKSMKESAMVDF